MVKKKLVMPKQDKIEILTGRGMFKVLEGQALIKNQLFRPIVKGIIPGSVKLRGKTIGKGEVTYHPSFADSPAHLVQKPSRNISNQSVRILHLRKQLTEYIAEAKAITDVVAQSRTLTLHNRVRLNSIQSDVKALERIVPKATKRMSGKSRAGPTGEVMEISPLTSESTPSMESDLGFAQRILAQAEAMLDRALPPESALDLAKGLLPETAFHDFSSYAFLCDPNIVQSPDSTGGPASAEVEQFLSKAREIIRYVVGAHSAYGYIDRGNYLPSYEFPFIHNQEIEEALYLMFVQYPASTLYEYTYRIENSNGHEVFSAFGYWLSCLVKKHPYNKGSVSRSCDNPEFWKNAVVEILGVLKTLYPNAHVLSDIDMEDRAYSFRPYDLHTINFGLRIVYRQQWLPLRNQPGEIVKTIPLGPKQVEKITTKIVTTKKQTTSSEMTKSTESTTETSDTTKDSGEVVNEAAKTFNYNISTTSSLSVSVPKIGGASASVTAGMGGTESSSSKDTKSHLNETMEKTAQKMRSESKVVVSTEINTTDEYTSSSEITNPNDEIAITYVYSKLQRQYQLTTTLSEVTSVIFIPERIPDFNEIDEHWIRKYDWILAKVLLDSSFADDLALVVNEVNEIDLLEQKGPDGNPTFVDETDIFKSFTNTVESNFEKYSAVPGSIPDIFGTPQQMYQKSMDRRRAALMKNSKLWQRKQRLINHIRKNILHYMRAIWMSEDPDQRMMRYSSIVVPTIWGFVPATDGNPKNKFDYVPGEFVADKGPMSLKPVTEIINPAGPIGFLGNYAIFRMRSDKLALRWNEALSTLRSHYVRFAVSIMPNDSVLYSTCYDPRDQDITYHIYFDESKAKWEASVDDTTDVTEVTENGPNFDFDGVRVMFSERPSTDATFTVRVQSTGELMDPEEREIRRSVMLPSVEEEPSFFTHELLEDIATFLPELASVVTQKELVVWDDLTPEWKSFVRYNYHRFLMLKGNTTKLLLETNNLMLDLAIGETAALEDYKRLHRSVDVMKELEEYNRRRLDNIRIEKRLDMGDLSDPDVDSNVTVGATGSIMDRELNVGIVVPSKTISSNKGEDEKPK